MITGSGELYTEKTLKELIEAVAEYEEGPIEASTNLAYMALLRNWKVKGKVIKKNELINLILKRAPLYAPSVIIVILMKDLGISYKDAVEAAETLKIFVRVAEDLERAVESGDYAAILDALSKLESIPEDSEVGE